MHASFNDRGIDWRSMKTDQRSKRLIAFELFDLLQENAAALRHLAFNVRKCGIEQHHEVTQNRSGEICSSKLEIDVE
ncbi:hypothetical protein ACLE20_14305 [Rhizobium sp. YIM 134829]|uniref:hypothetical protein n=1 Tax=Rhizobium sp. YIM 134829 TaxID=3390453 RepID=UPI00397BB04A